MRSRAAFLIVLMGFLLWEAPLGAEATFRVEEARKRVVLKGYTRAESVMTVSAEVSGKVLRVNYDVGESIGKTPIVVVDPTFVDFQIQNIRHALASQEIALKRGHSRVAFLEKEFGRIDTLFKRNTTPESSLDAAAQNLDQARLELEAISVKIAELKTTLLELQERRRRHEVHAPVGWVVTARFVEDGEIIAPDKPLARVADYNRLVVPLTVSDEELAAIWALAPLFDVSLGGRTVQAAVNWVNPEFDEATRKTEMEIILQAHEGEKRGGLVVTLPLAIRVEGLQVPKAAVVNRYENPRVLRAEGGDYIRIKILGETDGHLIVAEDGTLAPGVQLAPPAR